MATSDYWLMVSLGFLGSFGHCLGMCGPLSTALLLSDSASHHKSVFLKFLPVILLNIGRLISYALVGAFMGGVGSVMIAGGAWVGLGSPVRHAFAVVTGLMLVGFGFAALGDRGLPQHPFAARLHKSLNSWMGRWAMASPAVLGLLWGLMPCGFLYVAQLKAAETLTPLSGALTMLAFGLGTLPMMLSVGGLVSHWSHDRSRQLFKLGGVVTIAIGVLTIFRTSEMVDLTGHGAIGCLILALAARPLANVWPRLLTYRRAIGVSAGILAIAHTAHMVSHGLNWNLASIGFLSPQEEWGYGAGFGALLLLLPALFTSFDSWARILGSGWRKLHLLSLPALALALGHTVMIGSNYLGNPELTPRQWNHTVLLILIVVSLIAVRSEWVWRCLGQGAHYTRAKTGKTQSDPPMS